MQLVGLYRLSHDIPSTSPDHGFRNMQKCKKMIVAPSAQSLRSQIDSPTFVNNISLNYTVILFSLITLMQSTSFYLLLHWPTHTSSRWVLGCSREDRTSGSWSRQCLAARAWWRGRRRWSRRCRRCCSPRPRTRRPPRPRRCCSPCCSPPVPWTPLLRTNMPLPSPDASSASVLRRRFLSWPFPTVVFAFYPTQSSQGMAAEVAPVRRDRF